MPHPLAVLKETTHSLPPARTLGSSTRQRRQQASRARMERHWLKKSSEGNRVPDAADHLRIQRTAAAIRSVLAEADTGTVEPVEVADLGCGTGRLARLLRDSGANVHACDIATNALALARQSGCEGIKLSVECLPDTSLPSASYDCVVCADVIGEIDTKDYRLLISELARIAKREGIIVVSTPLDTGTDGALDRFLALIGTELDISSITTSHHSLAIRINRLLRLPAKLGATRSITERQQWLSTLTGLGRAVVALNTTRPLAALWGVLGRVLTPIANALQSSHRIVLTLEWLTKRVCSDTAGVSHVIVCGKKRELKR